MGSVVEEAGRVDMFAIDARLEMQMFGCSTPCATSQRNDITGLYMITLLDQVLGVVAIIGLETVGMFDAYQIAIAIVLTREHHLTIEGCQDIVVGLGLQVCARMSASTTGTVRADNLCAGQRITPVLGVLSSRVWRCER